jgi:hypothetical protein
MLARSARKAGADGCLRNRDERESDLSPSGATNTVATGSDPSHSYYGADVRVRIGERAATLGQQSPKCLAARRDRGRHGLSADSGRCPNRSKHDAAVVMLALTDSNEQEDVTPLPELDSLTRGRVAESRRDRRRLAGKSLDCL